MLIVSDKQYTFVPKSIMSRFNFKENRHGRHRKDRWKLIFSPRSQRLKRIKEKDNFEDKVSSWVSCISLSNPRLNLTGELFGCCPSIIHALRIADQNADVHSDDNATGIYLHRHRPDNTFTFVVVNTLYISICARDHVDYAA